MPRLGDLPSEVLDLVAGKLSARDQAHLACANSDMRDRVRRLDAFGAVHRTAAGLVTARLLWFHELMDHARVGGVAGLRAMAAVAEAEPRASVEWKERHAAPDHPILFVMYDGMDVLFDSFIDNNEVYIDEIFVSYDFYFSIKYDARIDRFLFAFDARNTYEDDQKLMLLDPGPADASVVAASVAAFTTAMFKMSPSRLCLWWPAFSGIVHAILKFLDWDPQTGPLV